MRVELSIEAKKQYHKLPKASQIIIARRVRQLGKDEFIQVEKLLGYKDVFRTRVGNYRLVYKKFATKFYVVLIGHRKEIYKLLRDLLK